MDKFKSLEAIKELNTLRDMLRWSITQFYQHGIYYGHGTDNAWDEALYIILHVLNLPTDTNPAILDAQLLLSERKKIVELIEKRVTERIPAAYLTQQAWFASLPFYVDERVLIPRSPMAELIEKKFEPWVPSNQINRILDLCTGSGCIAIACATYLPETKIDAVDISSAALKVAQLNVDKHQVGDQVRLIRSDLYQAVNDQIYDLIISNPPYVSATEYANLPKEYLHEPSLGLTAAEEGLEIVMWILRGASKHLSPDGVLIVEVGNSEDALIARYPTVPFLWLEFERGGGGVFLLTAEQLEQYRSIF